jgi:hypothetical protein
VFRLDGKWKQEVNIINGPYEHKVVPHQGNSVLNGPHQGGWDDTESGEDWINTFSRMKYVWSSYTFAT